MNQAGRFKSIFVLFLEYATHYETRSQTVDTTIVNILSKLQVENQTLNEFQPPGRKRKQKMNE